MEIQNVSILSSIKFIKCREMENVYLFPVLFLFELYASPSSFNTSGRYIVQTRVNLFRQESIVNVFFLLVDCSYCFTFLIFPKNPSDTVYTSTSTPYVTMATVRGGHSVIPHKTLLHHISKMADKTMDDILSLLCSHTKLERDKGLQVLEEKLKDTSDFSSDSQRVTDFQNSLASLVDSTDRGWEAKHGGLIGSKVLIRNNLGSDDFTEALRKQALRLMHDDEARVRIASGETLFSVDRRLHKDTA